MLESTTLTLPDEIPGIGPYNLERPKFASCCLPDPAERRLWLHWHSRRHELPSNLSVEPNARRCLYRVTSLMTSIPRRFQSDPKRPIGSFPGHSCRPAVTRLLLT